MTQTVRRAMSRSVRALMLRRWARSEAPAGPLPQSMMRPIDAPDLMVAVRDALDHAEDQIVYGGVIFLHAEEPGALPTPDQARVHTAALPPMDYFREPFAGMARLVSRIVRKLVAPLTRRQERFNLDLLEAVRKLEHRLEAQIAKCRELQFRVAELEEQLAERRGS